MSARTAAAALLLLAATAAAPAVSADDAPGSAPMEASATPQGAGDEAGGDAAGGAAIDAAMTADVSAAAATAGDAGSGADAEGVAAGAPSVAAVGIEAAAAALPRGTRSGLEIYRHFREGLAEPVCQPDASSRWRAHFAAAPARLAAPDSDVLPLFGYVVERLREAHLPTEFALIPFVESGFRPGARSAQGPAGLWQFIALTARNHKVPVQAGYDGRLSPVDSTEAAVRYLKTLHGMFAGDWRLAAMAYNAGEYRLLGALRRAGQRPADADPASLPMPAISHAYVRKLHALACLLEEAEGRDDWLQALDRPVPVLTAAEVPAAVGSLDTLARRHGADPAQLRRLNPAFAGGRLARPGGRARVLLPAASADSLLAAHPPAPPAPAAAQPRAMDDISDAMADASALVEPEPRSHVVVRGDSPWRIANRYGVRLDELLARNGLDASAVLRPGMVLAIDDGAAVDRAAGVAE